MQFEKRYVGNVYDRIADHFSLTRSGKTWSKISEFINGLSKGSLVADIGCGNGKNMMIRKDCFFIGCDKTENFVKICNRQIIRDNLDHILGVVVADNLDLPFKEGSFDAVISVAVIHHFSTVERRARAVSELVRVLKPGGLLFIQVWSVEQRDKTYENQDVIIPWTLRDGGKVEVIERYYHLFLEGELESLLSNEVTIIESGNDTFNWFVIGTKK